MEKSDKEQLCIIFEKGAVLDGDLLMGTIGEKLRKSGLEDKTRLWL